MTQNFSNFLRKWHIRIGISTALVLVMLSVTGILINHSQQMSFAENRLPKPLANFFYGLDEALVQNLQIGEFFAEAKSGELSISTQDATLSAPCSGSFIGARRFSNEVWFACEQQISIYLVEESQPYFIETLNSYSGLPTPIEQFGACNLAPCIAVAGKTLHYSPNQFSWNDPPSQNTDSFWSTAPSTEAQSVVSAEHNWERWLLDLHSGRLFGNLGVLVVDVTGIAILLLVFSGLLRWMRTRKQNNLG